MKTTHLVIIFISYMARLGSSITVLTFPSCKTPTIGSFSWPCGFAPSLLLLLFCPLSSFFSSSSYLPHSQRSPIPPFPSTVQSQALAFNWPVKMGKGFTWEHLSTWLTAPWVSASLEEAELKSEYKQHQDNPQQESDCRRYLISTYIPHAHMYTYVYTPTHTHEMTFTHFNFLK